MEACDNPVFLVLMIVGYYQGLRLNELVNLRWSAVNHERGVLHVENVVEEHYSSDVPEAFERAMNQISEAQEMVG